VKAAFELITKTTLLDISLQPNSSIEIPAMEMAFIYLVNGKILIADKEIESEDEKIIENSKIGDYK
jgi:redox-sensitive bicupin YhaK (pirin superfamily)